MLCQLQFVINLSQHVAAMVIFVRSMFYSLNCCTEVRQNSASLIVVNDTQLANIKGVMIGLNEADYE